MTEVDLYAPIGDPRLISTGPECVDDLSEHRITGADLGSVPINGDPPGKGDPIRPDMRIRASPSARPSEGTRRKPADDKNSTESE